MRYGKPVNHKKKGNIMETMEDRVAKTVKMMTDILEVRESILSLTRTRLETVTNQLETAKFHRDRDRQVVADELLALTMTELIAIGKGLGIE